MTKNLIRGLMCLVLSLACYKYNIAASDVDQKSADILKKVELIDAESKALIDFLFIGENIYNDLKRNITNGSRSINNRIPIIHDMYHEHKRKIVYDPREIKRAQDNKIFRAYLISNFHYIPKTDNGIIADEAIANLESFIECLDDLILLLTDSEVSNIDIFKIRSEIIISGLYKDLINNLRSSLKNKELYSELTLKEQKEIFVKISEIKAFKFLADIKKTSLYHILLTYKNYLVRYINDNNIDKNICISDKNLNIIDNFRKHPKRLFSRYDGYYYDDPNALKAAIKNILDGKDCLDSSYLKFIICYLKDKGDTKRLSEIIKKISKMDVIIPGSNVLYSLDHSQTIGLIQSIDPNALPKGEKLFIQNGHIEHGEVKSGSIKGLHIYGSENHLYKVEDKDLFDLKYIAFNLFDYDIELTGYTSTQYVSIEQKSDGIINSYNNIIASEVGANIYSEYIFRMPLSLIEERKNQWGDDFVDIVKNELCRLLNIYQLKKFELSNNLLYISGYTKYCYGDGEFKDYISKAAGSSYFSLNFKQSNIFSLIDFLLSSDQNVKCKNLKNISKSLVGALGVDVSKRKIIGSPSAALYMIEYEGIKYYVKFYFQKYSESGLKISTVFPISTIIDLEDLSNVYKFKHLDNSTGINLAKDYKANKKINYKLEELDTEQKIALINGLIESIKKIERSEDSYFVKDGYAYLEVLINSNLLLCLDQNAYNTLNVKKYLPIFVRISEANLNNIINNIDILDNIYSLNGLISRA